MIPQPAQTVLAFWFGLPSDPDYSQPKKAWFIKNPAFDQDIRDRFLSLHQQACDGSLDPWQNEAESCLALLIILDQFSRNLFRGTPKAFAADDKALAIAKHALKSQLDQSLLPVQRWFIYLPFEHSEVWADQQRSLELWTTLSQHKPSSRTIQYAQQHADIIYRYGRFPHRNAILNRVNTAAEREFLKQPGSSF